MKLDANKFIQLLKRYAQALEFGLDEEDDMNDGMRVRCTFCLMQQGAAYHTTKVKLKHIGNKCYLVCHHHEWVKDYHLKKFKYDEDGKQIIHPK